MIKSIGVAYDMAARNYGSSLGVWDIFYNRELSKKLDWQKVFFTKSAEEKLNVLPELLKINREVAGLVKETIENFGKGIFFSGDHSGAIGIWSGVSEAKHNEGDIGLIWFDAHMDCHTPRTSHSKNMHGMPLAFLLGEVSDFLPQKIKPENLCLIGINSYEKEEHELLNKLGCKVFYAEEVEKFGIENILPEAHKIVSTNTCGFGMSFDVDAFDSSIAPGTGYMNPNGLIFNKTFEEALRVISNDSKFLGVEISEYIPNLDHNKKTIDLIKSIINACFVKNIYCCPYSNHQMVS